MGISDEGQWCHHLGDQRDGKKAIAYACDGDVMEGSRAAPLRAA
jgi:hypothetical protein